MPMSIHVNAFSGTLTNLKVCPYALRQILYTDKLVTLSELMNSDRNLKTGIAFPPFYGPNYPE